MDENMEVLIRTYIHPSGKHTWDMCKTYVALKVNNLINSGEGDSIVVKPDVVDDKYVGKIRKFYIRLDRDKLHQEIFKMYVEATTALCISLTENIHGQLLNTKQKAFLICEVETYCDGVYFKELMLTEDSEDEYIEYFRINIPMIQSVNIKFELSEIIFEICKYVND